jgi:hypothetical protein
VVRCNTSADVPKTARARRRRCIWPANNDAATTCEYCASRNLRCVQEPPEGGYYHRRQARLLDSRRSTESLAPPSQAAGVPLARTHVELPPMPLRLELVNLYFDYIHDQFHSIFHRPSFLSDVAQDQVPAVVLLAIFALSAR